MNKFGPAAGVFLSVWTLVRALTLSSLVKSCLKQLSVLFYLQEKRSVQVVLQWTKDSLGSNAWVNVSSFYGKKKIKTNLGLQV